MPYIMEEVGQEGPITAQETAGHRSAGGEQLYCASLVFFGFYLSFFLFSPF